MTRTFNFFLDPFISEIDRTLGDDTVGAHDDLGRFHKILGNVIRLDDPMAHVPPVFTPGKHKDGFAAGVITGLDIGLGIADEKGILRGAHRAV